LWQLIAAKVVTKAELEEYYSVDDILKLAAVVEMNNDIFAAKLDEIEEKLKKQK